MSILTLIFPLFAAQVFVPPAAASLERARAAAAVSAFETVDELIAAGRKLFAEGKLDEALSAFQQAEKLDGATLRTRVFVLRVWIAQGRIEDVLLEVDERSKANKGAVELDYLYGMGFYALATRDIAAGQTTALTGSQFEDASRFLKLVTEKNDPRFEDAWIAMAETAWYTQDIEAGRLASEKAVELAPNDPWRRLLRGKLALSAYGRLSADASQSEAAEVHWRSAIAAFEKAIALCGAEPEAGLLPAAQQAWTQIATTRLWKQQKVEAGDAYARAIALDPNTIDYGVIAAAFAGQEFLDLLERAKKDWSAKHSGDASAEATLAWWLGYANYGVKKLAEAQKDFERALATNPGLTSALYYLFRVRFELRDFAGCLQALHKYETLDSQGLTGSLSHDVVGNSARLESLIGWADDEENHDGVKLLAEQIFASELITRIVPREADYSRHWNNLGLFLRDEGDRLRGTQGALQAAPKAFDEARVTRLWEDALAAYEVALELEPKNPNYLNDTAVMLHYYLLRDLERAKLMYSQGFEQATALLKRSDLSPETRDAVRIALRDTGNNVKLVQKLIDKRAAEAAARQGDKPANQ